MKHHQKIHDVWIDEKNPPSALVAMDIYFGKRIVYKAVLFLEYYDKQKFENKVLAIKPKDIAKMMMSKKKNIRELGFVLHQIRMGFIMRQKGFLPSI